MAAADEVVTFVLGHLPAVPARVLEVGAGEGDLARRMAAAGYEVVAVDPQASTPDVLPIPVDELSEPAASFESAVAVLSLHHVHRLDESCAHLASLLRPGASLIVDELDLDRFDEQAAAWWLEQQEALGIEHDHEHELAAESVVARLREELHPLSRILASLDPYFDLQLAWRGPYLYRWRLGESQRPVEEELIAAGTLPAIGVRILGTRV